jgi:colanic acid biosynthesis glycosyl transferase WcaI
MEAIILQHVSMFNQMAGPLFRELALEISERAESGGTLFTGHPDTLAYGTNIGSLRIHPMPAYERSSKSARAFSWFAYTLSAFFQMMSLPKGSIMIIVSNPPTLGPLAWLASILRGHRYFVLVYDLHPDTLVSFGSLSEHGLITRLWRSTNRLVWNRTEGVFTIGRRMAERLSKQFSPEITALARVEVVPPWADTESIRPRTRSENPLAKLFGVEDKTVVLYSGNMGYSHDINSILQAAELLSEHSDICFLLIGEGAKWQEANDFAQSKRLDNLKVLPFQSEERLPYTMSLADISLVALDTGAEGLMIPSKTFFYMAAGSAVIAICHGESELSDIIAEAQCGVSLSPGDPERLAQAITALAGDKNRLKSMQENSRKYCLAHHARSSCAKGFVDKMSSALKKEN